MMMQFAVAMEGVLPYFAAISNGSNA